MLVSVSGGLVVEVELGWLEEEDDEDEDELVADVVVLVEDEVELVLVLVAVDVAVAVVAGVPVWLVAEKVSVLIEPGALWHAVSAPAASMRTAQRRVPLVMMPAPVVPVNVWSGRGDPFTWTDALRHRPVVRSRSRTGHVPAPFAVSGCRDAAGSGARNDPPTMYR